MNPITIIFIAIFLAIAWLSGCFVGAAIFHKDDKTPKIGYLQFNMHDPSKEFLELHITQDIDPANPPEYVKLLVLVNGGDENNGSKA